MCGRYAITSSPEAIRALFRYGEQPNFPPRHNVAPTQPVPVVRLADGVRQFALLRWGLIPAWVKDPRGFSLLINARGESVCDKPAFRNAMKRRRCLLPADGFFEWQATGGPTGPEGPKGSKRPFFIRKRGGGALAFAGLWEAWMGPNGEEMETVCIVTTRANHTLAPIHDRMPVIVPPEGFDLWLDADHVDALTASALIAPAPDGLLEAWEVSTAVNRTANDSPDLLARLTPAADSTAPLPAPAKPAAKPATPPRRAQKPKGAPDQGSLF
ncbi:MAG: SOS response-associated peptidase [Rhodoplanes sp.]|uniref:SOS response-associated peptidase n=1 Tax=Rhodoplanes sp. TaxID=1968906 RepID=UPI0018049132|nr:SOS response-associated peptidase [Rhodoplanes sp.]NVO13168.1 SOS response-associated peptidase [Rhodoplanes sp.]